MKEAQSMLDDILADLDVDVDDAKQHFEEEEELGEQERIEDAIAYLECLEEEVQERVEEAGRANQIKRAKEYLEGVRKGLDPQRIGETEEKLAKVEQLLADPEVLGNLMALLKATRESETKYYYQDKSKEEVQVQLMQDDVWAKKRKEEREKELNLLKKEKEKEAETK
eukprot:TRINITY_DN4138_c0_g1_i1.p1 TRINITY_DN4138_c0_g1~~TRINITY_DN4138_c0_g1_i1.p1  ORF type:complete len:168 (+),score=85.40 TRINITY_DN4138_c0_g1_i1:506-1009(+)